MAYVLFGCVVISVMTLTVSFALIVTRFFKQDKNLRSQSLTQSTNISLHASFYSPRAQTIGHIWKLTAWFSRPFASFVTWGQRRRLSSYLSQAGLDGWNFAQIYFLQCMCFFIACLGSIFFLLESLLDLNFLSVLGVFFCALLGWWCPILFLKRAHHCRLNQISRQFPFFLDMVGLGLDAGLNLQAAIQLALEHVEQGALYQEWSKMLADMRSGQSRAQALRQLSQRLKLPSTRQLISSLIHGETMGFSLGSIIQIYADQQRTTRLMQAEKQALQAPVKMLFPMALCIFPCTFIILGFPVVVQLSGLSW